jgi:hypothetical protein
MDIPHTTAALGLAEGRLLKISKPLNHRILIEISRTPDHRGRWPGPQPVPAPNRGDIASEIFCEFELADITV